MSVKKKDRHISMNEPLGKARTLMNQILLLTHPREFDSQGKQIRKPGLLGEGQAFQAFGLDILNCGKRLHAVCYQAGTINLRDKESFETRTKYHKDAIAYCDSIFRLLDICTFQYANKSQKKKKTFFCVAKLTKEVKSSIQERMNRDKLIYEDKYIAPKRNYRRGR